MFSTTTGPIRLHGIRLYLPMPLELQERDMAELVGGCLEKASPLKMSSFFALVCYEMRLASMLHG